MKGKTIAILLDGLDYTYIRENLSDLPFSHRRDGGPPCGPDAAFSLALYGPRGQDISGKRLFGINAMHWVLSGGHRFTGVILGSREDVKEVGSVLNLYRYLISISGGHRPERVCESFSVNNY